MQEDDGLSFLVIRQHWLKWLIWQPASVYWVTHNEWNDLKEPYFPALADRDQTSAHHHHSLTSQSSYTPQITATQCKNVTKYIYSSCQIKVVLLLTRLCCNNQQVCCDASYRSSARWLQNAATVMQSGLWVSAAFIWMEDAVDNECKWVIRLLYLFGWGAERAAGYCILTGKKAYDECRSQWSWKQRVCVELSWSKSCDTAPWCADAAPDCENI